MTIKKFTFNPFQENTYIIYDDTKECVIIDPGCYYEYEKKELKSFINQKKIIPKKLINTHCHIDHVFGNKFITSNWNIPLLAHKKEEYTLENNKFVSESYGFDNYEISPKIDQFLKCEDIVKFGKSQLNVIFTPGHSPGHICLINKKDKIIISGDLIFKNSIGRTDLPGGNFETLMNSIKNKIINLEEEYQIFSGHGENTTLKNEKKNNPFLN
tara:strand:+ start:938 stop:1576 length:639 start_codon:yes stop_codon:yes gene_type:complete